MYKNSDNNFWYLKTFYVRESNGDKIQKLPFLWKTHCLKFFKPSNQKWMMKMLFNASSQQFPTLHCWLPLNVIDGEAIWAPSPSTSPPPHPPLPILPSHPESIWENGGSFLRGTMMNQVAIAPHTDHQWKKFSESAQWGSWETRIAKFDTRWISPRKIFNWYLVRYFWPTPCMTPSHNYHPGMPD